MNWKNTQNRYGSALIALHWLMLLLMVAVYACIELRELFPKGSDPRETLKALHFMFGLTVLIMVGIRLAIRLSSQTPEIQPAPPAWQRLAAKTVHIALYLLMIVMPVLGWLTLSALGKTIPFYGTQIPGLIAENKELGKFIEEVHKTIGTIGYFLIGLHALAALYHHYIMRDDTMTRMLPARGGIDSE